MIAVAATIFSVVIFPLVTFSYILQEVDIYEYKIKHKWEKTIGGKKYFDHPSIYQSQDDMV